MPARHVIPSYTQAGLPTTGSAGTTARVTDTTGGVWMDQGTNWFALAGEIVNVQDAPFNVHPSRTAAQNGTGLVAALATGKSVYIPPGAYDYDTTLNLAITGQQLFSNGQGLTSLTYTGTSYAITLGAAAERRLISVYGFALFGSATPAGGIQVGPSAGVMSGATIANMRISSFSKSGAAAIEIKGSVGLNLDHLFLEGNDNGIIDTVTAVTTGTHARSVWIQTSASRGIYLRRSKGFFFHQGTVEGSNIEAIKLDAVTSDIENPAIVDSWFENNNKTSGTYTVVFTGTGASVSGGYIHGGHWEANGGKKHVQLDGTIDSVVDIRTIGQSAPVELTASAVRCLVHADTSSITDPVVNVSTSSVILSKDNGSGTYGNVYEIAGKLRTGIGSGAVRGGGVVISDGPAGIPGTVNAWGQNADAEILGLNYTGYQDGTTYFRNTNIYDGKKALIASFTGSTKVALYAAAVVGKLVYPTYGASVVINENLGNSFVVTATNGTAFTVSNPTNVGVGQVITITIENNSGGVLGAVTWDTSYRMAAFVNPANNFSRSVTFLTQGAGTLTEVSRTPADVPL